MQRQTFIKALHDRERSKAGRVVSAPVQHHLRAFFQRPLEGFDAHLRDDIRTFVNRVVG